MSRADRALLLLLASALLGTPGCSAAKPPRTVRLAAGDAGSATPAPTPAPGARQTLRFAVAMPFSPHEAYRVYKDLADHLGDRLGRPVQLTFRRSFAEVNDLLRSRQADIVQLCNEGYERGRGGFGLAAIAVPRVSGQIYLPSFVVMRADRSAGALRTLGVAEPNCAPGQAGLAGATRKVAIKSHDRAIRAVREGLVDAALVDGLAFERAAQADPTLRTDLRILARTAPYLVAPVAVHPDLDPRLRDRVAAAFMSLPGTPAGRALLGALGVDRFEPPPAEPARHDAPGPRRASRGS
ncbi:MAG: PhnD/SsuA/transferrin family substrate-binding protein [Candidatus Sericytochromatia bacterium]|nr:PhnD/SsuA/transferrin family substrate-binding protein [Candidatus Tanganyikabacteria bacterium]